MSEHYEVMGSFPELKQLPTQEQIDALKAQVNCLRDALLNTIMYREGTVNYGDPMEALELTSEQCLAEVKAKAIEEIVAEFNKKGLLGTSLINLISDCVTQLREQAK